jgi:hypothetical protein
MPVLHDAPGGQCWITVTEERATRYLYLGGCEEGAMALGSEEPVFHYLWFHKLSVLALRPLRRILVLGAGAFTAPKCLALDYPHAAIDAVDVEPELAALGRRFFRMDRPAFARVAFHGVPAERFLAAGPGPYGFVFDDLFDGLHHVPVSERGLTHARRLRSVLEPGGVCLKNLIWDQRRADTRAACAEAAAAWAAAFSHQVVLALGHPTRGHNRLLVGLTEPGAFDWPTVRRRLAEAGVPEAVVRGCHVVS